LQRINEKKKRNMKVLLKDTEEAKEENLLLKQFCIIREDFLL